MRMALAGALLLLATARAAAQTEPACPAGPADDDAVEVGGTFEQPIHRIAPLVDATFARYGYSAPPTPANPGWTLAAPVHEWPGEVRGESWARGPHPGLRLGVGLEIEGDSTRVRVGARALCKGPIPEDGETEVGTMLELLASTTFFASLLESIEALPPVTPAARDSSRRTGVPAPDSLGDWALVDRHDYDDPRYGVQLRYATDRRWIDVFVYPGPRADSGCDLGCARARVDEETRDFIDGLPDMEAQHGYSQLRVKSDEPLQPGAGHWRAGRHLVLSGSREGTELTSHFYLFSYPGYMLKVRATHPAAVAMEHQVKAFVDLALDGFAPLGP